MLRSVVNERMLISGEVFPCLFINFSLQYLGHKSGHIRVSLHVFLLSTLCSDCCNLFVESTDSSVKSRLKTRMLEYIERAEKLKDCIQKRKDGI